MERKARYRVVLERTVCLIVGLLQEGVSGGREKETDRKGMVEDINRARTNLSLTCLFSMVAGREKYTERNVYTIAIHIFTKLPV